MFLDFFASREEALDQFMKSGFVDSLAISTGASSIFMVGYRAEQEEIIKDGGLITIL
jgi:hypothetical protein